MKHKMCKTSIYLLINIIPKECKDDVTRQQLQIKILNRSFVMATTWEYSANLIYNWKIKLYIRFLTIKVHIIYLLSVRYYLPILTSVYRQASDNTFKSSFSGKPLVYYVHNVNVGLLKSYKKFFFSQNQKKDVTTNHAFVVILGQEECPPKHLNEEPVLWIVVPL